MPLFICLFVFWFFDLPQVCLFFVCFFGFLLAAHLTQKKEDSTPKGSIDLRASKIDPADDLVQKPFTIRVAQSKQIFSYLQASSEEDRDAWISALRRAAGYRMEKGADDSQAPKVIQSSGFVFLFFIDKSTEIKSTTTTSHKEMQCPALDA